MVAHNKRKGDEALTTASSTNSTSFVYSPHSSQSTGNAWNECKARLAAVVVDAVGNRKDDVPQPKKHSVEFEKVMKGKTQVADIIQEKLQAKIAQAQAQLQHESHVVKQIQEELSLLENSKANLERELAELNTEQHQLQYDISMFQKEQVSEQEQLEYLQEARKLEVPRLRHQISLYANCTGIKWDFEQEKLLAGQVVRSLRKKRQYKGTWGETVVCSGATKWTGSQAKLVRTGDRQIENHEPRVSKEVHRSILTTHTQSFAPFVLSSYCCEYPEHSVAGRDSTLSD
jgi:hypothetical protein